MVVWNTELVPELSIQSGCRLQAWGIVGEERMQLLWCYSSLAEVGLPHIKLGVNVVTFENEPLLLSLFC